LCTIQEPHLCTKQELGEPFPVAYFLAFSYCGLLGRPAYDTCATDGCSWSHVAIAVALATWRSIRRGSVSIAFMVRYACNGAIVLPKSRSPTACLANPNIYDGNQGDIQVWSQAQQSIASSDTPTRIKLYQLQANTNVSSKPASPDSFCTAVSKLNQATPHHTTPRQAKSCQAKPSQAKQASQAARSCIVTQQHCTTAGWCSSRITSEIHVQSHARGARLATRAEPCAWGALGRVGK
jgi:thiol:disulfide interchange protein